MFSQVCVKNSVGGACMLKGACMAGGVARGVRGEGDMCGRGDMHDREGACVAGETVTAADGTHPTGIHSCCIELLLIYLRI